MAGGVAGKRVNKHSETGKAGERREEKDRKGEVVKKNPPGGYKGEKKSWKPRTSEPTTDVKPGLRVSRQGGDNVGGKDLEKTGA